MGSKFEKFVWNKFSRAKGRPKPNGGFAGTAKKPGGDAVARESEGPGTGACLAIRPGEPN